MLTVRSLPPHRGVTLLEIMLVLAIAAMIIVMSVRYYQSTTNAQQANAFVAQMQAIVAAMDQLAESTHSYANITEAELTAVIGEKGLVTPWGRMTFINNIAGPSVAFIRVTIPQAVCSLAFPKLAAGQRWGLYTSRDEWLGKRADYYCSEFSKPNGNSLTLRMDGYDKP